MKNERGLDNESGRGGLPFLFHTTTYQHAEGRGYGSGSPGTHEVAFWRERGRLVRGQIQEEKEEEDERG